MSGMASASDMEEAEAGEVTLPVSRNVKSTPTLRPYDARGLPGRRDHGMPYHAISCHIMLYHVILRMHISFWCIWLLTDV